MSVQEGLAMISQYGAQGALGALLLAIIAVLIGGGAAATKRKAPKVKPLNTAKVDAKIADAHTAVVTADQKAAVQKDHVTQAVAKGEGLAGEVNDRLHRGKRP